ncbi:MAG: hypothetical protein ABIP03_01400, partial [Aquihabitans sp.]
MKASRNEGPDPDPHDGSVPLTDRGTKWAGWALALLVPVALIFYLVIGRTQWFFQDEWRFLVERDGGDVTNLLAPHNEHWVTLPAILYRGLWHVLGLRHYEIYQLPAISAHIASSVLLWFIMRRAHVGPWIATTAATAFLFFADVELDITWAFQITFMGSVAFGLAQLVLADHDGPLGPRDVGGILAGVASVMCAATGLVLIPAVALTVWVRRGWRSAAVHTMPTTIVYLTWLATAGAGTLSKQRAGAGATVRFVQVGLEAALTRFAGASWLAVTLGLLASAGLVVRWQHGGGEFLRRSIAPIALAISAFGLLLVTGMNRVLTQGVSFATTPRYSHVAIALLLPLIAVGIDELVKRWHFLALPLCALLLSGIPVVAWGTRSRTDPLVPPALVLALAHSPLLDGVPRDWTPFPNSTGARAITAGWLQDSVAEGRIPSVATSPAINARVRELLALYVDLKPSGVHQCRPFHEPRTVVLRAGESVGFVGGGVFFT